MTENVGLIFAEKCIITLTDVRLFTGCFPHISMNSTINLLFQEAVRRCATISGVSGEGEKITTGKKVPAEHSESDRSVQLSTV